MYKFIKGIINHKLTIFSYLVQTDSWGIEIFTPYELSIGDPIELFLHQDFSTELGFTFYGFYSIEELAFFQLLITVPGLGAKTTIKMASQLGFSTIGSAIDKQASKVLTSISGIGNKIAARIVNDLKDKVPSNFTGIDYELINTLIEIGYSQSLIMEVVNKINPQLSLENKIQDFISLISKKID